MNTNKSVRDSDGTINVKAYEDQQKYRDGLAALSGLTEPKSDSSHRDTPRKWDHPKRWKGVRIGQCVSCKRLGKDVLRNGLCWLCDSLRMSEEARNQFRNP